MNKRHTGLLAAAVSVAALVLAGCGGGDSDSGGKTKVVVWNGYEDAQGKNLTALIAQYNKDHPDVDVTQLVSNSDACSRRCSPPSAAVPRPTWPTSTGLGAEHRQDPEVVDLSSDVDGPDWNWNDFYQGERRSRPSDGKVIGIPALVDNLAIVYNKTLFQQAGVAPPDAGLDLGRLPGRGQGADRSRRRSSTAGSSPPTPARTRCGTARRCSGRPAGTSSTPTTRRPRSTRRPGVKALTMLQDMAVDDKSVYLDTTNAEVPNLFNSGKIGMMVTGPWDLSVFPTSLRRADHADVRRLAAGTRRSPARTTGWCSTTATAQTQAATTSCPG